MVTVNVDEVGADLPSLVEKALAGEDVILAKNGSPIARLVPYVESPRRRVPGQYAGQIHVPDDFDETPQELIDEFEKGDLM